MKKGPLSQEEKNYILENDNKDISVLSEELDRSEALISKFKSSTKSSTKKESTRFERLLNKKDGSVSMTENTSYIMDEVKKKGLPEKLNGSIHKIK